jgi:hypothetical protein
MRILLLFPSSDPSTCLSESTWAQPGGVLESPRKVVDGGKAALVGNLPDRQVGLFEKSTRPIDAHFGDLVIEALVQRLAKASFEGAAANPQICAERLHGEILAGVQADELDGLCDYRVARRQVVGGGRDGHPLGRNEGHRLHRCRVLQEAGDCPCGLVADTVGVGFYA